MQRLVWSVYRHFNSSFHYKTAVKNKPVFLDTITSANSFLLYNKQRLFILKKSKKVKTGLKT